MANDVQIKVGADTTELTTGLRSASAQVDTFAGRTGKAAAAANAMKTGVTAAGVAGEKAMNGLRGAVGGVAAVMGMMGVQAFFDKAGRINDLSVKFGASAESIQRLQYAADQSGTNVEMLASAMQRGERSAAGAGRAGGELAKAFETLGMSASDFISMSLEERMVAIGNAYAGSSNKAETLAAMVKVLGRSAGELVVLFGEGGDAIKQMMDEATVASSDAIGKIDEMGDKVGMLFNDMFAWGAWAFGHILDWTEKWYIGIAAVVAGMNELRKGNFSGAWQATQDMWEGGMNWQDGRRKKREERLNRTSSDAVDQSAYTEMMEGGTEKAIKEQADGEKRYAEMVKDFKMAQAKEYWDDYYRKIDDAAKAEKKAADEAAKAKLESMQDAEQKASDELGRLNGLDAGKMKSDDLRRIGGGFAKSNYSGLSREATLISKQVDYASKQLTELKRIVTELQKSDPVGGITV